MLVKMEPRFESVKSYYGKAHLDYFFDTVSLWSYDTLVAKYYSDKGVLHINGEYSATTLRHIKEFAQQMGFPKLSVSDMRKHGYVLVKGEI